MAPEIFENKPYSLKADVYSFGVKKNNFLNILVILDCFMGNMFKRDPL